MLSFWHHLSRGPQVLAYDDPSLSHLYVYCILREIEMARAEILEEIWNVCFKVFLIYTDSAFEYLEGLILAVVHSLHVVTSLAFDAGLFTAWGWASCMSVVVVSAT